MVVSVMRGTIAHALVVLLVIRVQNQLVRVVYVLMVSVMGQRVVNAIHNGQVLHVMYHYVHQHV